MSHSPNQKAQTYKRKQKKAGKKHLKVRISKLAHGLMRELVDKNNSTNYCVLEKAIRNHIDEHPPMHKTITSGPLAGSQEIYEWIDGETNKLLEKSCDKSTEGPTYKSKSIAMSALICALYLRETTNKSAA